MGDWPGNVLGGLTVAVWCYLLAQRGGFWRLQRRPPSPAAGSRGRIVAVVPARDEAAVIGRALESLVAQDYPNPIEIVVVDDESRDGTAEAVRAAAAARGAESRLTLIRGTPVPPGWTGKLWAMHQGIAAARRLDPDYLLLTDADIVHRPDNLRGLVARSEAEGFDLVSAMVRLNCESLAERLLIPPFVFFFFKLYPPRWVADPRHRIAAAAGGCMLIRTDTLDRVGGVAGVRGEIIDDCALARRVKAAGGRVSLEIGDRALSIREYRSWRPIWRMIARSAFAQLGYSAPVLGATLAGLGIAYLAPPVLLICGGPVARICGALAWAAMAAGFLPFVREYGRPPPWALLLPVAALFYGAATLASAIAFWRGRGGAWKGRFQAVLPS